MILGIAGFQNSGKTTLVEILVPAITRVGFRVATVKHIAHDDLQVDTAGTDTHRHKKAGARLAVAVSDSESVYFHAEPQTLEEILARIEALDHPDLVLVEGFKGSPIPKIAIGDVTFGGVALYRWDGTAQDGKRIAAEIAESLRQERWRGKALVETEMERRRSAVSVTGRKLEQREKGLKVKIEDMKRSIRVMAKNESDESAPPRKSKGLRKRAKR